MADYIYTLEYRLTPEQFQGINLVQEVARHADFNLYITCGIGGRKQNGTLVKMNTSGQLLQYYAFPGGVGGASPFNLIAASDGNIYGTTTSGSSSQGLGLGTVFRLSTSGKVTIVVSPGVVMANAPCAAPHSTAHCGPLPARKP